jgi:CubicO group peptidase (beta-lactamase class C family)
MKPNRVFSLLILLIISLLNVQKINAQKMVQPISSKQIDSVTELVLKTFQVPGIAVAVVKDGKLIHAKGYGIANLRTGKKVDENTQFGIASNSKAFTTAALGMLVEEGKIKWDDKVTDYIPDFKMYNPFVTDEFTIRDLLTHRSGLGLGAGDLMMFPDGSDFTKTDIIHNLRYLKQVSSFRSKYDYDNNLYIVAGEVIAKVSGLSWEDFVEQRIMKPLGMNATAASISRLKDKSNTIRPHAPVNGKVETIDIDWSETANAAGGIWSNITDMSKWITLQMNHGKYGDSLQKTLFGDVVHEEMWSSQTIQPVRTAPPYNTHFSTYGLGWGLTDVKGYKQVMHTGGLAGIVTQVLLLPEIKLGIIVFTNQQVGAAFSAISSTIKDSYIGVSGYDWVKLLHDRVQAGEVAAKKITDEVEKNITTQIDKAGGKFNIAPYLGTYKDAWFGDMVISTKNGKPWLASKRSPRLNGELFPYKGNTLIIKWTNRSLDADAYVVFSTDMDGKPSGIKMNAISPLTDFSFDFQDLDFIRVK